MCYTWPCIKGAWRKAKSTTGLESYGVMSDSSMCWRGYSARTESPKTWPSADAGGFFVFEALGVPPNLCTFYSSFWP